MRIAITLSFDTKAETAVRQLWYTLEMGLLLPELEAATRYRPHITLTAYDVTDVAPYIQTLKNQVSQFAKFPLGFDAAGIFPENGVLFLVPRMTRLLMTVHEAVNGLFETPPIADHLRPDHWQPHCTLAVRLSPVQLRQAVDVCLLNWSPIEAICTGIGIQVVPETTDRWHGFWAG